MAAPTELADLTAELKERIPEGPFRFEWSSQAQGQHLLLCGDWNRKGRRSSRTLYGRGGAVFRKGKRPLSTDQRQQALDAGTSLAKAWMNGADTRQRRKRCDMPASSLLATQRRVVFEQIRSREGGHGVKQKHHRHARALFTWLDDRNQALDAPSAIVWAGEGVKRDTDSYADRLRVAQWACEWNHKVWVVPENKKPKKPTVSRPFVDNRTDSDLVQAFSLIQDPAAATFFRVVAATGCRPGEVSFFDWERWEREGRPPALHGYSPKVKKDFVAICHPVEWIKEIDISLLKLEGVVSGERPVSEKSRSLVVRHYSKLLKLVKKDLSVGGWTVLPTWTDLRHMWTIRAEIDGFDMRVAALAQAHSHKMAEMIYLRHGEQRQVLAEINRMASVGQVAA
jgi:integrase